MAGLLWRGSLLPFGDDVVVNKLMRHVWQIEVVGSGTASQSSASKLARHIKLIRWVGERKQSRVDASEDDGDRHTNARL
ncbi:hypothetical protein VC35_26840 [Pseudomonas fluorescens]|uniref:Uncharacterized protein n=1 Tax=Pseudomonas fluorescens TaxID=294 RepID=A0A0F4SV73_PSEFL|nr:hypothetical protein VC35_26840 [Pseudomonas fluorescens]